MVSRASFKIRWATFYGFRYQATRHLFPRSSCLVLGVRGCVKSPTSDNIWPEHVLISGGNPHLTSRFCRAELDPTTLLNMVSEPIERQSFPCVTRFTHCRPVRNFLINRVIIPVCLPYTAVTHS